MTRKEVRKILIGYRQTHLLWARLQALRRRAGVKPVPWVGAETHHRKCVKVYDKVLELIQ